MWIIDNDTYEILQKLKQFVKFVSSLKYATEKDKVMAAQIISQIENINNPSSFKGWNVCLDITDPSIQNSTEGKLGFYWRSWSVWFTTSEIEIEAISHHTSDHQGHYGDDFNFYTSISFEENISHDRIYKSGDISTFIADAEQYKKYITESLNEIEIEINIGD